MVTSYQLSNLKRDVKGFGRNIEFFFLRHLSKTNGKWFPWVEMAVSIISIHITSKCTNFDCRLFFHRGEIWNFLDMEILNFTWLPWEPNTVTGWGSGYPLVFKVRPLVCWYWAMHKQPYLGRIAYYARKKTNKKVQN